VSQYTRGDLQKMTPARSGERTKASEARGVPGRGRIVRLLIGQGHGFIRLANDNEAFFHRSDLREGTSFNEFAVGDTVKFELLEDHVSGPRAVQVERASDSC
jgi:cold shock CspA family protein